MSDLSVQIRLEADMNAMTLNMARFVDEELAKRAVSLKEIAEKTVSEFNFEKEFREQLAYAANEHIRRLVRARMEYAANEFLKQCDINVDIKPHGEPMKAWESGMGFFPDDVSVENKQESPDKPTEIELSQVERMAWDIFKNRNTGGLEYSFEVAEEFMDEVKKRREREC